MEAKFNSGAAALLNDIIEKAAAIGASDIHVEPNSVNIRIRFRLDGLLQNGVSLHRSMQPQLISRIKILADLDISESRVPQDGRTFVKVGAAELDLRVSVMPTVHGEKAVLRLLDRNRTSMPLEGLGLPEHELKHFKREIDKPQGLIIVCGPTGCGKTTTLYSAVDKISSDSLNIVTIEDPIEYQLPRINQVQVNNKAGMTFAKGLRGILRQDPDVIMVGEIRDNETAAVAVQAAMTGHLVFSTLHTNDARSAVTRLADMGIEKYLINDTLRCIMSQRLVRKICINCRGKGCKDCRATGYKGRTGIFEMLIPRSDAIFSSIRQNADTLVEKGITTKEEVLRNICFD